MLQPEIMMEIDPQIMPPLGRQRQVLIIEDDKAIRGTLSRMLVSWGHKVTLSSNGFDGGLLFCTRDYDLVIIDLQVPQVNIWELARILKEHSPKTPVIVASGLNRGEPLAELDRDRVDAIIPKPFELKELEGTVRRVLNGRP